MRVTYLRWPVNRQNDAQNHRAELFWKISQTPGRQNKDSSKILRRIKAETSRVTVMGLAVKDVSQIKKELKTSDEEPTSWSGVATTEMLLLTVMFLQLLL